MKVKSIPSSWLVEEAHRFDCSPFTSGGIEARKIIEGLPLPKNRLAEVTNDELGGVYHVGQEKITWVDSSEHGMPFLRSSDIMKADLSDAALISTLQVRNNPLFQCPAGTTLITRSGTIGRTIYARSEMESMAISQDVLKVVPNKNVIPPGYLFAYLSSRYGLPQIISGTFGSIIVHIEAENIESLLVPRFDHKTEAHIHQLVENASQLRTRASQLLIKANISLLQACDITSAMEWYEYGHPLISSVRSGLLTDRMDSFYYCDPNAEAFRAFQRYGVTKQLDEVARVFIPGIFKRRYAEDAEYGTPYLTGADIFTLAPTSDRFLLRSVAAQYGLLLNKGMIVIQEAGQLSGIIGRSVLVGEYLDGFACSNNMVRVVAHSDDDIGYIFAALNNLHGIRLLKREAAGSSIPHLDAARVRRVQIPWANSEIRRAVSESVKEAIEMRDKANRYETEARIQVELQIEECG